MELVRWRVENIPPRQAEKGGRQRAVQEERKLGRPFSSVQQPMASVRLCLPACQSRLPGSQPEGAPHQWDRFRGQAGRLQESWPGPALWASFKSSSHA